MYLFSLNNPSAHLGPSLTEPCAPSLKYTSARGSVRADEDAPQYHSTHEDEDHTRTQGYLTENNIANPHTH